MKEGGDGELIMRVAITIEDGRTQLVLTPETKHETACLGQLHDGDVELTIRQGEYYACQGGWTRQRENGTASTILVMEKA
jgi:hypothetical protein